tara:strand:+ start:509 stop:1720 length:1212 start_codon:yes stop_codon:yes gene_type:complete
VTYKATVDWMFGQLPMYQQKGKAAFKAKLDNIWLLATHLDHPENKFKSIHVGGTNGKGSSSHMLASILQEAGYKVGLYTSPHLKDFRERIRINGSPVAKKFVIDFIKNNKSFFESHQLSFFEMSVGMAFDYFAKSGVDIAVVEVGLGGRLDSTNIIMPEVSLITNIGYDHIDMLGDTLEKIAFEKAGIIKPKVPIVISETQRETQKVFATMAAACGSKLVFADTAVKENYDTALLGNYQTKNIKGVIAVLRELKGFHVNEDHIIKGLQKVVENTGLMGRWQVLGEHPKIVCDTAHNTEGIQLVLHQIKTQKFDVLHLVLGFVKEKNLQAIFPLLPKKAHFYFCRPNIPRGLDVHILQRQAAEAGITGDAYPTVKEALAAAIKKASKSDFIFVGGSNFVVAEVV